MRAFLFVLITAALAACGARPAADPPAAISAAGVQIRDAWAAPTPNGVDVSAGYLTIENTGSAPDSLLSAASPRAARVEIHEMVMNGAEMQMRPVEGLALPVQSEIALAPGGRHLMFFGVTQPFQDGEQIPVRLTFEHAGAVDVSLTVRRNGAHDATH